MNNINNNFKQNNNLSNYGDIQKRKKKILFKEIHNLKLIGEGRLGKIYQGKWKKFGKIYSK